MTRDKMLLGPLQTNTLCFYPFNNQYQKSLQKYTEAFWKKICIQYHRICSWRTIFHTHDLLKIELPMKSREYNHVLLLVHIISVLHLFFIYQLIILDILFSLKVRLDFFYWKTHNFNFFHTHISIMNSLSARNNLLSKN